jgi:O-acetyl-ADP-ribose deacetylase (regulator of RNase III)
VAFPAISCGAYGYPLADAARIAVQEVVDFLKSHDGIDEVLFVCFDAEAERTYSKSLRERLENGPHD